MNFRKAKKEDIETIAQFQVEMAWETESYQLDKNTVQKGVEHIFDHEYKGFYLVTEVDGKIVSSLLCLYEWSDWRNGEVLWIHSLFVKKEWRRKGIFKQKYNHLKELVRANDYKGIRLYVEKENHNAQEVYQAIGMTKEHYEMYEWLK